MNNLIKTQISFNSKFSIIIINFALFVMMLITLINSVKEKHTLIIIVLSVLFIINSFLILFFLNWILKRFVFLDFYLKDEKIGLEILDTISQDLKISINNIEGNIFYASYMHKRILGDKLIKDVFFILEGKRILLNIQNRNDSIFIYSEDLTEKRIKEILAKNSWLSIQQKND